MCVLVTMLLDSYISFIDCGQTHNVWKFPDQLEKYSYTLLYLIILFIRCVMTLIIILSILKIQLNYQVSLSVSVPFLNYLILDMVILYKSLWIVLRVLQKPKIYLYCFKDLLLPDSSVCNLLCWSKKHVIHIHRLTRNIIMLFLLLCT